ncbi:hypothetical protein B5X24_HaOG200687 [Helicoverpa armigera]|uniref:Uncharacterized protein n=1 Tax=Helicoverpa armigera TaxID=29058 RepID=A0A2W1BVY2_HELAM|nr:hypothetical protein B5X24_HaOG200687 [Helicoverpa armigera]
MFQSKRSVILLTTNKLDEDILRIVRPFNVVLTAIASSKFKIKNRHITPCVKTFHLLICFSIIALKLWSSFMFVVGRGDFKHKKIVDNFFCLTVFFYCVNYTLLTYNNIMHSCHNISLFMKIQDINRNINISVQSYVVWTWISFLITLILFISDISWFLLKSGIVGTVHVSENILVFQFDINFVYGIRLVTLLVMYLKEWARSIIIMTEERPNEYFVRKLETYVNILEAFKLFTICFKAMVSWFYKLDEMLS